MMRRFLYLLLAAVTLFSAAFAEEAEKNNEVNLLPGWYMITVSDASSPIIIYLDKEATISSFDPSENEAGEKDRELSVNIPDNSLAASVKDMIKQDKDINTIILDNDDLYIEWCGLRKYYDKYMPEVLITNRTEGRISAEFESVEVNGFKVSMVNNHILDIDSGVSAYTSFQNNSRYFNDEKLKVIRVNEIKSIRIVIRIKNSDYQVIANVSYSCDIDGFIEE